jgi:hypothetical protein
MSDKEKLEQIKIYREAIRKEQGEAQVLRFYIPYVDFLIQQAEKVEHLKEEVLKQFERRSIKANEIKGRCISS